MYDTPAAMEQQLSVDWRLLVARDSFRRFVNTEDISVKDGSCKQERVRAVGHSVSCQVSSPFLPTVMHNSTSYFPPAQALEAIRPVLSRYAVILRSVFSYYATCSLDLEPTKLNLKEPSLGINAAQFERLIEDMGVVNAHLPSAHCK